MPGNDSILDFLVVAKQNTYASQRDDASVEPLLPGSRQLEYRDGSLLYRDVYFGTAFFVGQETVYMDERPYWSMCYSGGVDQSCVDPNEVRNIYAFLRAALRQVSGEHIFRGPSEHIDGEYTYRNTYHGGFEEFHGSEYITNDGKNLYTLQYSGGMLR